MLLDSNNNLHGTAHTPNAHTEFFNNIDRRISTYFIIHGWLSSLATAGLVSIMERLTANKLGNPIGE